MVPGRSRSKCGVRALQERGRTTPALKRPRRPIETTTFRQTMGRARFTTAPSRRHGGLKRVIGNDAARSGAMIWADQAIVRRTAKTGPEHRARPWPANRLTGAIQEGERKHKSKAADCQERDGGRRANAGTRSPPGPAVDTCNLALAAAPGAHDQRPAKHAHAIGSCSGSRAHPASTYRG